MIAVRHLSLRVGPRVLHELGLEVPTGQHACLMGRTGVGKTTLVEAVCGLRPITRGEVWLMGREVSRLPPAERGIGFVPQDGALFGHLTVRQHLEFALRVRGWAEPRIEERVKELTGWLALGPLLQRKPAGLSGGERQRVALGRALSFHPRVLCLDEPLAAVDEEARAEIGRVLQEVRRRTGVTILHVTHNATEARRLADRLFLFRDGSVQLAPPGAVAAGEG